MKTIPLKEAHKMLVESTAVVISDGSVIRHFVTALDGLKDNKFLQISWRTIVGSDYTLYFTEGDNQQIRVEGEKMTLVGHESCGNCETFDLWLLVPLWVEQQDIDTL
jgi:hypothetical protein